MFLRILLIIPVVLLLNLRIFASTHYAVGAHLKRYNNILNDLKKHYKGWNLNEKVLIRSIVVKKKEEVKKSDVREVYKVLKIKKATLFYDFKKIRKIKLRNKTVKTYHMNLLTLMKAYLEIFDEMMDSLMKKDLKRYALNLTKLNKLDRKFKIFAKKYSKLCAKYKVFPPAISAENFWYK